MNVDTNNSLESVWKNREDTVFPSLFGKCSRGIFTLTEDIFASVFGEKNVDPIWLHHGVFEYTPTEQRNSWVYVTSGLSNPWKLSPKKYSSSKVSGLGIELVMETSEQADWPIYLLLKLMAYAILLDSGKFGKTGCLDYGHRIPLGAPITPNQDDDSLCLNYVIIGKSEHYPCSFQLASGAVNLLHFAGVTGKEIDYAKQYSSELLIEALKTKGYFPITAPNRQSLL